MINKFSTLQRVLLGMTTVNIFLFVSIILLELHIDLDEIDFLILSGINGITNLIFVWLMLRTTFNNIKRITNKLQQFDNIQTLVDNKNIIEQFKNEIYSEKNQIEIQELIDTFNNLINDIDHKAKKTKKIINNV